MAYYGLYMISVMCLDELPFYPHDKSNVFGRVSTYVFEWVPCNIFKRVWYNIKDSNVNMKINIIITWTQ